MKKLCSQCHERPVSARPDSIFCDECVEEMEIKLTRRLAEPRDEFDLFARIKKNAEASQ